MALTVEFLLDMMDEMTRDTDTLVKLLIDIQKDLCTDKHNARISLISNRLANNLQDRLQIMEREFQK